LPVFGHGKGSARAVVMPRIIAAQTAGSDRPTPLDRVSVRIFDYLLALFHVASVEHHGCQEHSVGPAFVNLALNLRVRQLDAKVDWELDDFVNFFSAFRIREGHV
jgi:hypothetical protein